MLRWRLAGRRGFLRSVTAVAGTFLSRIGIGLAEEPNAFTHSPASFDVSARTAIVWVRGRTEGQVVQLELAKSVAFSSVEITGPTSLSRTQDLTHCFELLHLEPDTLYYYRPVSVLGGRRVIGETGQFRTAPEVSRAISFVVGADMLALYQPFRVFDQMRARKPEFFLNLGDTIYADHPVRNAFFGSLELYRRKHAENRDDGHLQKFMLGTPTFATWDDHEVENNFDRNHPKMQEGRQAFIEWWPRHTEGTSRIYRRFSWGPNAEFFMLDTRQYRSPANSPDDGTKTMIGAEQKAWLKESLRSSSAPLKILLSPSPFNNNEDRDSWGGFRLERDELSDFVVQNKLKGVFVISGDWHIAIDLSRRSSSIDEVVVGPLAAWPQFQMNPRDRRFFIGTGRPHVGDELNFGYCRVDPTATGARLTLDVIDINGKVRFSKVIET